VRARGLQQRLGSVGRVPSRGAWLALQLACETYKLNPDPPLRRGVHALVPEAQMAAQVLLKRPLLRPSLPEVLPNRAHRLADVVKGPPARIRRAVAGGERGFQRRYLVVQMLQGVRVPRRLQLFSLCL
jgi:hypothetical protein